MKDDYYAKGKQREKKKKKKKKKEKTMNCTIHTPYKERKENSHLPLLYLRTLFVSSGVHSNLFMN